MLAVQDVIEACELKVGRDEAVDRAVRFMTAYLSLIQGRLPTAAADGLSFLKRFCAGEAHELEARKYQLETTRSIQREPHSLHPRSPDDYIVQAVARALELLCKMNDDPSGLAAMSIESANRFEDHSSEIGTLLKKHFP